MKKSIVLIGHGFFPNELKNSLKMIAGDVDNIFTVCLELTDGPDSFEKKISSVYKQLNKDEKILVFADLLGGSPCNAAFTKFVNEANVDIISGMNFPMILTALLNPSISIDDLITEGKKAILDVKKFNTSFDFEEDE